MRRSAWIVALASVIACDRRLPPHSELSLRLTPQGDSLQLALVPAPGVEVNARLPPALELDDGAIVRFRATRLTPDSAYFAEPPMARFPIQRESVAGTLRASVCSAGERICRPLTLRVSAHL